MPTPVTLRTAAPMRGGAFRLSPRGLVLLLIVVAAICRLAFAAMLGLGVDESYMVAAGREFRFGYFDHPPAAWWLSWAATHAFGSDSQVLVRLPFIALFALSTWLMFCIGRRLYGARAGWWAALAFNLSPVLGVTTGTWVLPDGPLDCALLGMVLFFISALAARTSGAAWSAWLAAGLCAGLAMFSKYSAALPIAGAAIYLLTEPTGRRWLRRPQPYVAASVAAAVLAPVLLWNVTHGWQSIAFQAGRAGGDRFHPLMPFAVLGGEALFLLPWIWLPMCVLFVQGVRRGPSDRALWLQVCLGGGLIVIFPLIALWSDHHVLFHWGVPGWMMMFPALGAALERAAMRSFRWFRPVVLATVIIVPGAALLIAADARWAWIPEGVEDLFTHAEPEAQIANWRALAPELRRRGLLNPALVLAGVRWNECGKLDYAFGNDHTVLCLSRDAHEYTASGRNVLPAGARALVITSRASDLDSLRANPRLRDVASLGSVALIYRSEPVGMLWLFLVKGQ